MYREILKKEFGIISINISDRRGIKKNPVQQAYLKKNHGICNDAHAGHPVKQVSLLAVEDIEEMKKKVRQLVPGDFAENITTSKIDLASLPIGTLLALGEARIEVSQIGKECHDGCYIKQQAGDCVMPRRGIFARVIKGGTITTLSRGFVLSIPD